MGIFRVYEDGSLVGSFENTLTVYGEQQLLKMISGHASPILKLLVGGGSTASADTDKTLELPIAGENVIFATPIYNGASSKIVYKARLGESVGCLFYEMTTSNDPFAKATRLVEITSEPGTYTADAGTTFLDGRPVNIGSTETRVRVSPRAAVLTNTAGTGDYYESLISTSISGALDSDVITLSGFNNAAGTANLTLTFTDVNGLTATGTTSIAATTYSIATIAISALTIQNGFDKGQIAKTRVTRTDVGGPVCNIDGVTLRSETLGGKIISRAVTSGVVKRYGSKMDLEYEIPISL